MYCNQCGTIISEGAKFCKNCGNQVSETTQNESTQNSAIGTVGYSNKIYDPAFSKYVKNSSKYALGFGIFLAVAAVIGFYIAGEVSNELDNPESLMYGFIIGGMFLLISLFTVLSKNKGTTWDGVVEDKKIERKRRRVNSGNDDSYMQNYTVFTVFIRANDGKKHEIRIEDNDSRYNYFQIGDQVRHHKGLNSYEKFDKSKDSIVFCNACATINQMNEENCHRCKCPLLK